MIHIDVQYYDINEEAARHAKTMNSFYEYKPGSATAEYRRMVDNAAELAEKQKAKVDPMYHDKIDHYLDKYAHKLAENMNNGFAIDARVPSVLIAGPANFPVRAKEKQNAARDKNMEEWRYIQGLLDKIQSTGMGGITFSDPNAREKLESKLAACIEEQEFMKGVNAYHRKHGTLDGCPLLTEDQTCKINAGMARDWRQNPKPFASFHLSNNSAEIRRLKGRIAEMQQREETGFVGWKFEGGEAVANMQEDRLQLVFDEIPTPEQRAQIKSAGFRWSPKRQVWQRQLTKNALYAAGRVDFIKPLDGRTPLQLQPKGQQEKQQEPER